MAFQHSFLQGYATFMAYNGPPCNTITDSAIFVCFIQINHQIINQNMSWKVSSKILLMAAAAGLIMAGCKGKKADASTGGESVVNARELSDPDMLNPINLTSVDGR